MLKQSRFLLHTFELFSQNFFGSICATVAFVPPYFWHRKVIIIVFLTGWR